MTSTGEMTTTGEPTELLGYAPELPITPSAAPSSDEPRALAVLSALAAETVGLRGALVATVDGRPIAAVLPEHEAGSTAAIVAASLGLGDRLADLSGEGDLQEIVVRSASGYVVIYAVGERGVLTVLTQSSANLALLHLRARQTCADLAQILDGAI